MQCHAVSCSAMQCHAVSCSAMQCHAVYSLHLGGSFHYSCWCVPSLMPSSLFSCWRVPSLMPSSLFSCWSVPSLMPSSLASLVTFLINAPGAHSSRKGGSHHIPQRRQPGAHTGIMCARARISCVCAHWNNVCVRYAREMCVCMGIMCVHVCI